MFRGLILLIVTVLSTCAFAHEGHDGAPGALKSNHGGTVKAGKELNLEYLVSGSEVKLFPMSHDGKDLPTTEVIMTVNAKTPKGKSERINLEVKDGAFSAVIDFKGAYRIEMNVEAENKGKKSTFKFQVEK